MASQGLTSTQYLDRARRTARVRNIIHRVRDEALTGAIGVAKLQLIKSVREAVRTANQPIPAELRQIGEVFSRPQFDRARRAEVHRQIGVLAQERIKRSYDQLVTANEGPASKTWYRSGENRLAGGVMRRALSSPAFFTATPDGLDFINITMLDNEAKHWHRLAFGAGDLGQGIHAGYGLTFGDMVMGAIELDQGPSPAFLMPAGLFISPGGRVVAAGENPPGSDTFHPRTKALLFRTRGIKGRNFFDIGMRTIAEQLPDFYHAYFEDLFAEQKAHAGRGAQLPIVLVEPDPNMLAGFGTIRI